MNNFEDFLKALPEAPGVYIMYDEKGNVIYIGKSKNLKSRVSSYFHDQKKPFNENKTNGKQCKKNRIHRC